MKKHAAVILAVALLLGATAASASTAPTSTRSLASTKAANISVGLAALWISAPIYVALRHHFFEKEGLNVTPVPLASTPAMVAAAKAGSIQFGVGALSTEIQSQAQGLGLKIVMPNAALSLKLEAIATGANSGITSLSQLAGKNYCVNIVQGQDEGQAKWSLIKAGINQNSVNFIAVPFAQEVQALVSGEAAACEIVQPYLSQALAAHQIRVIGDDTKIFGPKGSPATAYFGTRSWVSHHTGIVKRFVKAMTLTHKYIGKHPNSAKNVLPVFTGVTKAQAQQTAVGTFPTAFSIKNLQLVANRFVRVGLVSNRIKVASALWKDAPRTPAKHKKKKK